jgi:hypothetical protein
LSMDDEQRHEFLRVDDPRKRKTGYAKVDLASGLSLVNIDITAISQHCFSAFDRAGQEERGAIHIRIRFK